MITRCTFSVSDQLRDILQICPNVGNKKFLEPLLRRRSHLLASLSHSGDIRKITNVNVNKKTAFNLEIICCYHHQMSQWSLVVRAILPVALTNEDIRNSESYKEYYAIASGTIPPKTKGSKKKANTDTITKQKPPTAPTEKKSGKGKLKTTELETISEADLTEAEQLKIITKRSRQETHSSHASGSGADEGTGVTPGVPDAPNMTQRFSNPESRITHVTLTFFSVNPDALTTELPMGQHPSLHKSSPSKTVSLVIQTQQTPILTSATSTSSLLQNLPNFASLFGFDYRLKALEDNFSELRQTNQYAESASSILASIREELLLAIKQFLDSIDEGNEENYQRKTSQKGSLQITQKSRQLVSDQLESEVLVLSSNWKPNTSHAVAANFQTRAE
ncbi:hypothetical protein Tco_1490706 [Tanacetum coccineum]